MRVCAMFNYLVCKRTQLQPLSQFPVSFTQTSRATTTMTTASRARACERDGGSPGARDRCGDDERALRGVRGRGCRVHGARVSRRYQVGGRGEGAVRASGRIILHQRHGLISTDGTCSLVLGGGGAGWTALWVAEAGCVPRRGLCARACGAAF